MANSEYKKHNDARHYILIAHRIKVLPAGTNSRRPLTNTLLPNFKL